MIIQLKPWRCLVAGLTAGAVLGNYPNAFAQEKGPPQASPVAAGKVNLAVKQNADRMLSEGMQIFRFDTFGSEDFWGGRLKLHEAIAGEKLGGKGPGLSPERHSSSA